MSRLKTFLVEDSPVIRSNLAAALEDLAPVDIVGHAASADDAAKTVAALRAEGHRVLIRCVAGQSRTPTVGIAYAMLTGVDVDTATKGVCSALPAASPNRGFRRQLENWRNGK